MGIYREVGKRIRERLLARGYVKSDGELDIERFSWDFRFGRTNLYNWIGDRAVPFKDLLRLCTALECSVEWLLTGKEREMGKGHPRQGRGAARKLLLALSFGAALWPRDSVAARGQTPLQVSGTTENSAWVDYVNRRRFWSIFRYFRSFRFGPAYAL